MTPSNSGDRYSTIPCSAREGSPALAVSQAAFVAALELIESLPQAATGALVFRADSEERGTVLVEEGRVCWAASRAMERRLTDILRHQASPPIETRVLERVYQRCREDGTPLGEALVKDGVVTDRGLRSALRQHSAEAIALLGTQAVQRKWQPHSRKRYDARYTFSTADLLVSLGALHNEELAGHARKRLAQVVDGTSLAVAYVRSEGAALAPIGALGADEVAASALIDLGNWVSGLLDLSRAFAPERKQVAATYSTGASVLAWPEGSVVYATLSGDRKAHARSITRARREG